MNQQGSDNPSLLLCFFYALGDPFGFHSPGKPPRDDFKRIGVLADIKILFESVLKVFKKEDIYETKADESMSDVESAKFEEEEIIRIAHLPD